MRKYFCLVAFGVACGGDTVQTVDVTGDAPEANDEAGPVIEHDSVDDGQPYGEDVLIEATVVDEGTGVFSVTVFFQEETSTSWTSAPLVSGDDSDLYSGVIPGALVGSGGMNYFIEALDYADNDSTVPEDGEVDPYHFRVSAF